MKKHKFSLNKIREKENYARYKNTNIKKSAINEAWEQETITRNKIGKPEASFALWKLDYEILINKIDVDLTKDSRNKKKEQNSKEKTTKKKQKNNEERLQNIKIRNNLSNDVTVIYTDGSKLKNSPATGASVIIEKQEKGFLLV